MPRDVGGSDERGEGLVAAEQRIDRVERRRVVAMRAPGREDRGEVEDVHAQRRQVVEAFLDSAQIAAEPLERSLGPASGRKLVPLARYGPLGRRHLATRRCEAIREHLVHDGLEVPVGATGPRRRDEVVGVGDVERLNAHARSATRSRSHRPTAASDTASPRSRRETSRATRRPRPSHGRSPHARSAARRRARSAASPRRQPTPSEHGGAPSSRRRARPGRSAA